MTGERLVLGSHPPMQHPTQSTLQLVGDTSRRTIHDTHNSHTFRDSPVAMIHVSYVVFFL